MSNIRSIARKQINLWSRTVPAVSDQLLADRGYVLVHVPPQGNSRTSNYTIEKKVYVKDLLALPGIASNLPTSDPGIPGSLWNNAGVLNISQ